MITDFNTATWQQVVRWANAYIETARKSNDNGELDLLATASLRGEIKALKTLLGLQAAAARNQQFESVPDPLDGLDLRP
jgi:hypothetical protein